MVFLHIHLKKSLMVGKKPPMPESSVKAEGLGLVIRDYGSRV